MSEAAGETEHPRLQRLLRYWDDKRGGRPMPARRDIDPFEIPDLLPHVFLVGVSYDPLVFRFRLAGSEVNKLLGEEITGKTTDEIKVERLRPVFRKAYEDVVRSRQPAAVTRTYEGHNRYLVYTRLLLPLSADGEVNDMLLGCILWLSTNDLPPEKRDREPDRIGCGGSDTPRLHQIRAAGIDRRLDHGQEPPNGVDQGRDSIRRGKLGTAAD